MVHVNRTKNNVSRYILQRIAEIFDHNISGAFLLVEHFSQFAQLIKYVFIHSHHLI